MSKQLLIKLISKLVDNLIHSIDFKIVIFTINSFVRNVIKSTKPIPYLDLKIKYTVVMKIIEIYHRIKQVRTEFLNRVCRNVCTDKTKH